MTDQILGTGTLAAALRHHLKSIPPHIIFCAWDTPIKPDGKPDTKWVLDQLNHYLQLTHIGLGKLVVITSQLPVGTCKSLEKAFLHHRFVVYPENVRAAHAIEDFANQPRIVLGSRNQADASEITRILALFTKEFIITNPETAEMVKHGLNGFLALSITYAHELAELAKKHGAKPDVLASALLSDPRIGPKAYLKPGGDMGPHLGREVHNLVALGGGRLINAMAETI